MEIITKTVKHVTTPYERLEKKLKKIYAEIEVLQSQCPHPKPYHTAKNRGSSGNWDPHDDCYWAEHDCKLCGKHWTSDQQSAYEFTRGSN